MKLVIEIPEGAATERNAQVSISARELAGVHLHLAYPHLRNRTGHYLRRHPLSPGEEGSIDPNRPYVAADAPQKLSIPDHLREMRRVGLIPLLRELQEEEGEVFATEPMMLAVTVSDLTANLLRPAYHRDGLGPHRLFYFDAEPIAERSYFCACFFEPEPAAGGRLELRQVRFDPEADRAVDEQGHDLLTEGLVWAAALVPLVADGQPLPPVEIARHNYDLRQMLGRSESGPTRYAYAGWAHDWDKRVAQVVGTREASGRPFASFYHGLLALDAAGCIHIRQVEGTLPDLAVSLAREGMTAAGLLDSGGSCALYDVWLGSYLNCGWYFREPRGSILVFELKLTQRLSKARHSGEQTLLALKSA